MTPAKRLRFTADDDLALLREFISKNPLTDAKKWVEIQNNLLLATGKNFRLRTLKDHLQHLLEVWIEKDKNLSEEEKIYSEKDLLLQEVSDMCKETVTTKRKKPTLHLFNVKRYKEEAIPLEELTQEEIFIEEREHEFKEAIDNSEIRQDFEERRHDFQERRHNFEERRHDFEERRDDIEERRVAIEERKVAVEERKVAVEERKVAVEERKVAVEERKVALEERRVAMEEKKIAALEKNGS